MAPLTDKQSKKNLGQNDKLIMTYVAFKSFNRLYNYFKINNFINDDKITSFFERVKDDSIISNEIKIFNNYIEDKVVDFDEANEIEARNNYFYFALLEFILYLLENNEANLKNVLDEVMEFYRNIAEDEYLQLINLGAVILNEAQNHEIEKNPIITNELLLQERDLNFANKIEDWELINKNNFD